MISIYREGQVKELGLSVGWVNGLALAWTWVSLGKQEVTIQAFRFRTPKAFKGKRIITRKDAYSISDKAGYDRYCFLLTGERNV